MPFDINEGNIVTEYVHNHTQNSQQIYKNIQNNLSTEKEKRTRNLNTKHKDAESLSNYTIFIKN